MQLIELLNKLEQAGTLSQLYQSGVLNLKAYSQREVYTTYKALLALPAYCDRPGQAVQQAAQICEVCPMTVYRAIKEMEQPVTASSPRHC